MASVEPKGPVREDATSALRRMLANGPMTAMPRSPRDQALLLRVAAASLEPGRAYSERELNEALKKWLEGFVAPYGIDHVTLRRALVDARLLEREKSGASYRVSGAAIAEARNGNFRIEPGALLEEARQRRSERKMRREARIAAGAVERSGA